MNIIKFGGSSVATPERVMHIMDIIRAKEDGGPLVVVVSAFGGVTDQLLRLSEVALQGDEKFQDTLRALEARHLDAVRALIPIQQQSHVLAEVKSMFQELEDVVHGIYLVHERTPRMTDFVASFGERLSAYIISEAIRAKNMTCEYLDARKVIRTDDHFGNARVDFGVTNELIRDHFLNHPALQIVTGFIGSSHTGLTTTLGRSGSDYTAAILAGALKASRLEIWTDVNGMMTADPRKVTKAFTVPEMTYAEAMELSHFGAKVIFPATMQPAMVNNIPIAVKNTFSPDHPGTIIHHGRNAQDALNHTIKGISSMSGMSLLSVEGTGLLGVVGVSSRLFAALARVKVNVILISQASSEHSICFAVDSASSATARKAIEEEFQYEIRNKEMDPVAEEDGLAIIAIVGENMRHNPGTSGRMFSALGKSGINIYAIAQGSSELNISAVIRDSDTSKALNVLHEAFFLSDRKAAHVFLVGTGLIGGELVKMIGQQFSTLATSNHLEVHIVGLANSRRMLIDAAGIKPSTAVEQLNETGIPMSISEFYGEMKALNLPNSIFVDCTASEEIAQWYDRILEASISVVTPNKRANSGPQARYAALKKLTAKRGVRFLYETNVGAGLPVINTLNDLMLSGDKVIRIEAVLSGTLNYIFSNFDQKNPFSSVVKEAREKGYTEPDPRDDLSGMDVARKILILSREAGAEMELNQVTVEGLVPKELPPQLAVSDFLLKLPAYDASYSNLLKEAEVNQKKLRFMAVYDGTHASVGLVQVDQTHPFYDLKGTDNVILLTTERYHERPMVIRGPGAGATVTATGVFADVIRIGNYGA